jgi:hypothetical protein
MSIHPSDIARARELRQQIADQETAVANRRAKLAQAKHQLKQLELDRQELNNIIAESVLNSTGAAPAVDDRRVVKGAELVELSKIDAIKVLRDPDCKLDLMTAKHMIEAYRDQRERDRERARGLENAIAMQRLENLDRATS